jgi:hypothetical protein
MKPSNVKVLSVDGKMVTTMSDLFLTTTKTWEMSPLESLTLSIRELVMSPLVMEIWLSTTNSMMELHHTLTILMMELLTQSKPDTGKTTVRLGAKEIALD